MRDSKQLSNQQESRSRIYAICIAVIGPALPAEGFRQVQSAISICAYLRSDI